MRYYASTNVAPTGATIATNNSGYLDLIHRIAGDNTDSMTFRTSPDRFAKEFNEVVPGAYRKITAQDIVDMTACGLIGKYNCYPHNDIETIRAILRYEELRQKRIEKQPLNSISDIRTCRLCGIILPVQPIGKYGRPKEYCPSCEPVRAKARYRKWRNRKHAVSCSP